MTIGQKEALDCLQLENQPVRLWLKRYTSRPRRWRLAALAWLTRLLDLPALTPPPHAGGELGRKTEERRLRALARAHVRVPQIHASGPAVLMLTDMGETLAQRLGRADPQERLRLAQRAVDAIAKVHAQGLYLGQPLARNITVDQQDQIGFLDFEEDPAIVMSTQQAQCRDWLIFVSGTIRHLQPLEDDLAAMLARGWQQADPAVIACLRSSVARLGFLPTLSSVFGKRGRALGRGLRCLEGALFRSGMSLCLLLACVADLVSDGDLDMLRWFWPSVAGTLPLLH